MTAKETFSIDADAEIRMSITAVATDPKYAKCLRGAVQLVINLTPKTTTAAVTTSTTHTSTQTTTTQATQAAKTTADLVIRPGPVINGSANTTPEPEELGPGDFTVTSQIDAGACNLFQYTCKHMTPTVHVMLDVTAGSGAVSIFGEPRERFTSRGNSTTIRSGVGHRVVSYQPGYNFDNLRIDVCNTGVASVLYSVRVFMDLFAGDGILYVPQVPVVGSAIYKPALESIAEFSITISNLGRNEGLLKYDAAQQAVVYTGSPDKQELIVGESFELLAVHTVEGSTAAPPGCLDVFRHVHLLGEGAARAITWENDGNYIVNNLKEYAPDGEARTARRLRQEFLASQAGQVVVTVTAIATAQFSPVAYKITSGDAHGAFAVDSAGVVSIINPEPLDADDATTKTIQLGITAYGSAGDFSEPDAYVTIALVDVVERPVLDPAYPVSVASSVFSVPVINMGGLPAPTLGCISTNSQAIAAMNVDGTACDVSSFAGNASRLEMGLELLYDGVLQDSKELVVTIPGEGRGPQGGAVPGGNADAAASSDGASGGGGMGSAAIAGIVIGLLILLGCIIALALFLVKREKEEEAKGPLPPVADSLSNPMYDVGSGHKGGGMVDPTTPATGSRQGHGTANNGSYRTVEPEPYARAANADPYADAMYAEASQSHPALRNGSYVGLNPDEDNRQIYDLSSNSNPNAGVNNPMYGTGPGEAMCVCTFAFAFRVPALALAAGCWRCRPRF